MNIFFSEKAKKDFEDMPSEIRIIFTKHIEKIACIPPRRHLKYGIPYHVEEVTKQSRLIYEIRNDNLYIIRCFKEHKEYERWYKSYN